MDDLMLDLLQPRTDAGVNVQWAVMTPAWALIVWRTWSIRREVRLLIWGVISLNLAWFLIRMAH